jgi:hypothetical protein
VLKRRKAKDKLIENQVIWNVEKSPPVQNQFDALRANQPSNEYCTSILPLEIIKSDAKWGWNGKWLTKLSIDQSPKLKWT